MGGISELVCAKTFASEVIDWWRTDPVWYFLALLAKDPAVEVIAAASSVLLLSN